MQDLSQNLDRVLITEEQLSSRICELAAEITEFYQDKDVVAVSVLKGAFIFMADLVRHIPYNVPIDFMAASSYGSGTTTTGKLNIRMDVKFDVKGKNILIVEDILDSGVTLSNVYNMFVERGAASVKICTLLDKPARHKCDISADYVGFTIPDEFVVGYGLDYAENYRNLPYVGVIKSSVYQ